MRHETAANALARLQELLDHAILAPEEYRSYQPHLDAIRDSLDTLTAAEFLGDEPWQGISVVDALFILRALSDTRSDWCPRAAAAGFWPDVWERTLLGMVYGDTQDVTLTMVETTLAVLIDVYGADDPPPRGPIIDRAVRALRDALAMLKAGPQAERGK